MANYTPNEQAVVAAAEKIMRDTMARYDPSHDAYHASVHHQCSLTLIFIHPQVDLVTDGRARTVTRIVDNVSWSTEKKLRAAGQWTEWHDQCLELHCVQDADRLDAIGAFGVLRCAAFNASTNHPLYTPADDPNLESSAIQHFHDKLVHIKDRLKTAPGQAMGERRHQVVSL
uniref:Uncharacterized protein n=1 Tax=Schizophyllum commune (strain H4-8 / FGSC 9210) TaxID=578458 RepID=D8Q926_SCHCM